MDRMHDASTIARTEKMSHSRQQRPSFPKRAVVTAGMPYGNKALHFGHVGGMFVHADVYARFLRDRIGRENVLFVSGTDCYGSAIEVTYHELVQSGAFEGSIEAFVAMNHQRQKAVLDAYGISLDLYAASALGEAGEIHREISQQIFQRLHAAGYLRPMETMLFYDEDYGVFLNGRQVKGRCPIQGCKSEYGYADECSLGHQYSPEELIHPISVLSGKPPVMREARNWFFDLERFGPLIEARQKLLEADPTTRGFLLSIIDEFLRPPMVYVKKERMEQILGLRDSMPPFDVASEGQKASDALVFEGLAARQAACKVLDAHGIRYRTGKTLVPFRLSGNIDWGIPIPEVDGMKGLTFWVWPESLWAPISFTKALLESRGEGDDIGRWWASADAMVYQFIGEDNIYFYDVAQTGLFIALQEGETKTYQPPDGELQLTTVVPNRHILFMKKKASSSGAQPPPKAEELLEYYTQEQLRMHFFHLNLGANSVGFEPKSLLQPEKRGEYDPVLYEGNILTNIFNRLIRSCFYSLQRYFEGRLPLGPASQGAVERAEALILGYEQAMYRFEFGKVIDMLDAYLRDANKAWAAETKRAEAAESQDMRAAILVDSFHAVRVATTLLHPLVEEGTERVRDYLNVGPALWRWEHIFEQLPFFFSDAGAHRMKHLEPRVDFFKKHERQLG